MGALTRHQFAQRALKIQRDQEVQANAINLPDYLKNSGFDVKKESKNGDYGLNDTSAGSFGLRFKNDIWLAFQDKNTYNSVQLIEILNSCDKKTAIYSINRLALITPKLANNSRHKAISDAKAEVILAGLCKPKPQDIIAGSAYLKKRGINLETFEMMRLSGSAEFSWNGLSFIGKQVSGAPGMVETRLFIDVEIENKPGKFTGHLVKTGSKRMFPVVILGDDNVEIVEGNFDGMALFEINKRASAGIGSTIIVSGGKDNAEIFKNSSIVAMLKNAKSIKCWGDNEVLNISDFDDDAEYLTALDVKQKLSDSAHQKRIDSIKKISPLAVVEYCLPNGSHDLAILNAKFKEKQSILDKTKVRVFNF